MRTFSQIISAREWENQHITHHNVVEAHAPLNGYTSLAEAVGRTRHAPCLSMGFGSFSCSIRLSWSAKSLSLNILMIPHGSRSQCQATGRCKALINRSIPM